MRSKVFFWMWLFIFSIVVAFPVILPYLHVGYFPTHDGEWAVVRLTDMFRTLRDLQIPARYSGNLNFGYGYPLFNFVYPTPYYLGTLLHFLGFGFVDTIKIIFAGSVPLSAFFMFLASRNLWKNTWAGVVSAALYVYLPYRMVDLYVRGSIGESFSFVLFPLLFYLAIKLIEKTSHFWVLGIAISLAALVTTHNIMTVLFMPVFVIFIISQTIFRKKKDRIKSIILSIVLGVGLSAFFWIPALFEKHNILLSQTPIADRNLYFVELPQLLLARWGYGAPTDPSGFTYQFGLPHLIVLFLAIFVLLLVWYRRKTGFGSLLTKTAFLLVIVILIFIFLLFRYSAFLWEHLPFFSEINYPWTVLGILGFLVSLLAGFLCEQKITRHIAVALSLVAVALILPYAKPRYYVNRGDNFYLTNDATTTSSSELMPLWVKRKPDKRPTEKIEVLGLGKAENVSYNSKQISFSLDLLSQSTVRVNTIYYPGWKVSVDGKDVPISYKNDQGVINLSVSSGGHMVKASFGETPVRLVSDVISIISVLAFLAIIATRNKRRLIGEYKD